MRWCATAWAAALLAACSASDGGQSPEVDASLPGDAGGVTFATVSRQIIAPRCSGPTCHGDGAVLSFAKRAAVVGGPARSAECAGFGDIVVPFEPDASLLYTKLTAAPCGSMMPLSTEPMPAAEIAIIRDWIAAGAP